MITKKHTYSYFHSFSEFLAIILSLLSILLGLFLIYVFISSFIRGDEIDLSDLVKLSGYILAFVIWSPGVFLFVAYQLSDIDTDEVGLHIIVMWKKYCIKWNELVDVKYPQTFGIIKNKKGKIVIVKSKLTIFHRLYGFLYGGVNKPALLIHKTISDYDILIKNISVEVAKNNRANS